LAPPASPPTRTALSRAKRNIAQYPLEGTALGETRSSTGTTPTDYLYTGQRLEAEIGLYFYNARFYDAKLGRFTQADTIIPGAGKPLALDRYAYVANNPLKYTDPSGHYYMEDPDGKGYFPPPLPSLRSPLVHFDAEEGIVWQEGEKAVIRRETRRVANAYASTINTYISLMWKLTGETGAPPLLSSEQAFHMVHGGAITFKRVNQACNGCSAETMWNNTIKVFSNTSESYITDNPGLIIHELGHAFNNATGRVALNVPSGLLRPLDAKGWVDHGDGDNYYYGYAGGLGDMQYANGPPMNRGSEEFADMFLGWVHGGHFHSSPDSELATQRQNYMNNVMFGYLMSFFP